MYGFIQEPVFRYIKNGNTGIPKYPVYRYIITVDMRTPCYFTRVKIDGCRRASVEREDQIARTHKIANRVLVYTSPCLFNTRLRVRFNQTRVHKRIRVSLQRITKLVHEA